ncbi:uncharacterized protein N7496_004093 [Penicillium cataractarum]|uniref:SRR1-like domain-containing protein n=1 Tax=Penicillium cataractarum TaxID=2100454 RepID=A0A9W9SNH5_9EURO|nr:uncharacterized protein N7496_004093 [Penicillium cataractarum]KAJ5381665.1 hypothetical protein N7496_004093 [Penicillium cataractarum]
MPHTSHKKRTAITTQKRLQVTDDDGWTHVTSTSNVRRVLRRTRTGNKEQNSDSQTQGQAPAQDDSETNIKGEVELVLGPAEAPGRLTLEELQTQYQGYRERWGSSETWKRLEAQLGERFTGCAGPISGTGFESTQKKGPVDAVVCVGLGSPSGFLRGGWVDRRSVSMYQLAALESIAQRVSNTSTKIPIYAQDPVFNTLDKSLLSSLNITVITHPAAFTLITPQTLLFCPGAERKHLEQLLPFDPYMVFGGPLEDTESDIIQEFAGRVGSVVLVPFEGCEHAFWKTRLYYREEGEGGVSREV